ncbi:putative 2-isopropylmalate synthase [Bienertia sinuspersici]
MRATIFSPLFISLFLLLNSIPHHHQSKSKWVVEAQLIPAKFDGFVHGNPKKFNPESILIEAFFDPVCPDTRDSWPPLKKVLHFYGSKVSLIVHPFPLPYHDNAFATSRAVHIVNGLNSSATYPLWESFFKDQEKFYNQETSNKSRTEILDLIVEFVTKSVGHSYYSAVKSGFSDRQTDLKTRVSFKYGCSRGVYGTPPSLSMVFFCLMLALP